MEEAIQGLTRIENRAKELPLTAEEWVTIASAKRHLNHNSAWHDIIIVPKYNQNGVTDFIVSSAHGHIEGEAHTYTPDQWSAHIGFNANRDFKWAYEKDLIMWK